MNPRHPGLTARLPANAAAQRVKEKRRLKILRDAAPELLEAAEFGLRYAEKEWMGILNAGGRLSEGAWERYNQEPVFLEVKAGLEQMKSAIAKAKQA